MVFFLTIRSLAMATSDEIPVEMSEPNRTSVLAKVKGQLHGCFTWTSAFCGESSMLSPSLTWHR